MGDFSTSVKTADTRLTKSLVRMSMDRSSGSVRGCREMVLPGDLVGQLLA